MNIGASQLSPGWGDEVTKASAKAGNIVLFCLRDL